MTKLSKKEKIQAVKRRIRVTKTVATRSVKGRAGDHYVGFAAAWDTVQEDGGHTLVHAGEPEESPGFGGMSLKEARLSALILGMQADLAAHDHAMAGGNITEEQWQKAVRGIKFNYARLISNLLGDDEDEDEVGEDEDDK